MGETCRELSLGGFLIHLVTSFQDAFYIAGFTREGLANMPYEQISIQPSILFSWFSPTHGILWKIYLNGVWWRVQISYSCLIISWRISHPHLDIRNVIQCLNILLYLINSKTTCNCLTWIVLLQNFINLGNDSQLI